MELKRILQWLKESPEAPVPFMDGLVLVLLKICYLFWLVVLRLVVGKTRRNNMSIAKSFWLNKQYSPSYSFMRFVYKSLGIGKIKGGTHLLKIRVPRHDYQYYCRIEKGEFTPGREEEIIEMFSPGEGDVVVDIGAHIGRYTINSSKRVGSRGKVIALEAAPDNSEILNRNIKLNGLTNVLTLNRAAYSKKARLKLYEPSTTDSIYNTIMPVRGGVDSAYVEVDADTLDSILHAYGIEKVDWIKIDVEGAEFEVLKGAVHTLSTNGNTRLLIEVHDIADDNHYNNIVKFLDSHGYKIQKEKIYLLGKERHVIFAREVT